MLHFLWVENANNFEFSGFLSTSALAATVTVQHIHQQQQYTWPSVICVSPSSLRYNTHLTPSTYVAQNLLLRSVYLWMLLEWMCSIVWNKLKQIPCTLTILLTTVVVVIVYQVPIALYQVVDIGRLASTFTTVHLFWLGSGSGVHQGTLIVRVAYLSLELNSWYRLYATSSLYGSFSII